MVITRKDLFAAAAKNANQEGPGEMSAPVQSIPPVPVPVPPLQSAPVQSLPPAPVQQPQPAALQPPTPVPPLQPAPEQPPALVPAPVKSLEPAPTEVKSLVPTPIKSLPLVSKKTGQTRRGKSGRKRKAAVEEEIETVVDGAAYLGKKIDKDLEQQMVRLKYLTDFWHEATRLNQGKIIMCSSKNDYHVEDVMVGSKTIVFTVSRVREDENFKAITTHAAKVSMTSLPNGTSIFKFWILDRQAAKDLGMTLAILKTATERAFGMTEFVLKEEAEKRVQSELLEKIDFASLREEIIRFPRAVLDACCSDSNPNNLPTVAQ